MDKTFQAYYINMTIIMYLVLKMNLLPNIFPKRMSDLQKLIQIKIYDLAKQRFQIVITSTICEIQFIKLSTVIINSLDTKTYEIYSTTLFYYSGKYTCHDKLVLRLSIYKKLCYTIQNVYLEHLQATVDFNCNFCVANGFKGNVNLTTTFSMVKSQSENSKFTKRIRLFL